MLRIVILIVALGAGGLAGLLTLSMRSGSGVTEVKTSVPQTPMAEVLVASGDIPPGQALTEANLRWQPWPMDNVNSSFITRSAQPNAMKSLSGLMARSNFVSSEPIREDKLYRSSSLLASMLPPGKRAVAIRISVESTAGGFILPNDRVDVIQTITRMVEGQNENVSRILLTNIRVLAIDQKFDEVKGQAVVMGKTATLELSPSQAEAIAAGQASGILSFALRSAADSGEETTKRNQDVSVRFLRAGQSALVKF